MINCKIKTRKQIILLIAFSLSFVFPQIASAALTYIPMLLNNIINAMRILAFSLVIIFWIITGILFLIARGSPEGVNTAKKSLFWTLIGTMLVILAQVMVLIIRSALFAGV